VWLAQPVQCCRVGSLPVTSGCCAAAGFRTYGAGDARFQGRRSSYRTQQTTNMSTLGSISRGGGRSGGFAGDRDRDRRQ
jgi:hypothetical protein